MTLLETSTWFDGLGSALVGGVVAALTAVFVVQLTMRGSKRQQLEAEVRAQAIRVMALGKEISTITTTLEPQFRWTGRDLGKRREQAFVEFQIEAFTLEAMLVPVNVDLARRLQEAGIETDEINPQWVRKIVNLVSEIYNVRLVATADELGGH